MWRCLARHGNNKFVRTFNTNNTYTNQYNSGLWCNNKFTPTKTPPHTSTHVYTNSNTNTTTVITNSATKRILMPTTDVNYYPTTSIPTPVLVQMTKKKTLLMLSSPTTSKTYLHPPITKKPGVRYYTDPPQQQHHRTNNKKEYIPKIKAIRGPHPILDRIRKFFSYFKRLKPLTADHIFAIFSWAVFGTTFWIVVGTTTLLSTILWVINTLRFQEWVALKAGAYLTRESGVHISFESAVGDWKHSTIRVHNVILAREGLAETGQSAIYLTIDRMDVNLSLLWMLEGKGILRACKASGVRGFVDRRPEAQFMANNPNYTPSRRPRKRGDFEVENLTVSDLLIQLYLPDTSNNRPLPLSIYTLECERFRKQWLLLDLLSAKSVVGKFDGCLFTFGIPQKEDVASSRTKHKPQALLSSAAASALSRERELKIDGVPMSLLSKTATGPLGWIKEGTLDISLSITLPSVERSAKRESPSTNREAERPGRGVASEHEIETLVETGEVIEGGEVHQQQPQSQSQVEGGDVMELRFDVMFNHLRVVAPLYTPELSYLNNAVVHPILAYMNSHSKHIPLSFDVRLSTVALDGAWTPSEAGLWDGISASVAMEFGRVVHDTQTTETLRNVANTLLKDCWQWLTGWVYTPVYTPA